MDIPRPKPKRRHLRSVAAVALVAALVATTVALGRLKRAPPSVDKAAVWVGEVKRGEMIRAVRGPGALVPEHIRWLTADTAGRVERISLRPGTPVTGDTVLLELSNPDVLLQALEAERQLANAEALRLELKASLETQALSQRALLATLQTDLSDARRKAEVDQALAQKQFASKVEADLTRDRAAELTARLALENQRLGVLTRSAAERLAAQASEIEKLRAVVAFRRQQVASLKVKAGGGGVLMDLPLELGQWVTPGTLLAKVVKPDELKAELRIPETQAKDVALGQRAEVDTHNGVVAGAVSRIEPAAKDGAVKVEVSLTGPLPKGARPDLTVEGAIELERLPNVLYVGRPAGAQPEEPLELFRVGAGDLAEKVKVQFGRASVNTIEVKAGLSEGDRVVLSDMSSWDSMETVRLK